ncbi:MAG: hypothetical protein ABIZ49_03755 [Opitutaceae bacterium]
MPRLAKQKPTALARSVETSIRTLRRERVILDAVRITICDLETRPLSMSPNV